LRIRKIRAAFFEMFYFAAGTPSGRQQDLNGNLAGLERYERRAFSQRKRALHAMYRSAMPAIARVDTV
jgi:hypothetical protein